MKIRHYFSLIRFLRYKITYSLRLYFLNKACLFYFIFSLWLSPIIAVSQNLVPNNDFEIVKNYECSFSTTKKSLNDYLSDWYNPTTGTTDMWFFDSLYNKSCSQNLFNFSLKPQSGNICIGLYTSVQSTHNYREYAQIKLKQSLTKGKSYLAKFRVRLYKNLSGVSTNHLGMLFTTEMVKADGKDSTAILLGKKAQVVENSTIDNSQVWTEIKGCFTATESYNYLTIGNFFSDEETQTKPISNFGIKDSYYFVDNVEVEEQVYSLPALSISNDTTLCYDQKLTLKFDTLKYKIIWQDGSNISNYTISKSGQYWVTFQEGECEMTDTLNVKVLPSIKLPNDTIICQGESILLNPRYPFNLLIWNDKSSDSTLIVRQTGAYWVKVNTLLCNISDTITVQFIDCPGKIPNVFTPNGDGINDTFTVENIEYSSWRLQIHNRWGAKVYDIEPYKNNWQGENLPTGLYYYYLSSNGLQKYYKGWVQIIR